ncbi:MAG: hypothetical protein JETT_3586 [Candidatus Jettenia ecosi]|uniref:Uncharacterized protein n=1 Tax=Candidatus Jettenia ecosi TaxID=2494326 RepID=A0A533QHF4_9BACT|nr:MAG: hypothetical protein JETT_3756 [Candidatus Jettenia ecosi]TLD40141.1 MAG: hypothetical protein JETT_3586 [Candidatus Jettenia ecosi]
MKPASPEESYTLHYHSGFQVYHGRTGKMPVLPLIRETEFLVHVCSQTMSSWKWGRVWEQAVGA